ncbi:hypothetical protein [Mycobacteroides abscessus]|uniref:hypothetical protein n=1 Tax=Mycobacteroides abscessus TaxID=36809 RepID=UPI000C269F18|nr:hypothetical protein [Mycobacteroides abscessus]
MSDEPSDAQKLIADVLKPLIYADMRYPDELFAQRRAEAYAAEVDKALGGLTKVWSEVVVMDDGYTYPQWNEWYDEQHHAQKAVYDNPGTVLGESFMSGWTVTE